MNRSAGSLVGTSSRSGGASAVRCTLDPEQRARRGRGGGAAAAMRAGDDASAHFEPARAPPRPSSASAAVDPQLSRRARAPSARARAATGHRPRPAVRKCRTFQAPFTHLPGDLDVQQLAAISDAESLQARFDRMLVRTTARSGQPNRL